MYLEIENSIKSWLINLGVTEYYIELMRTAIVVIAIYFLCLIFNYITKLFISKVIKHFVDKSDTEWDDIIYKKKVFNKLSHFVPALFMYNTLDFALVYYPKLIAVIQSGVYIYMIGISMAVLISFFNALNDIYHTIPSTKGRSIKGFIQIADIIVYFIGSILILSIILNKNPSNFLAGLGAFAAILLLIFKDALLGFVAGIQLSANNMVKLGEWISIPSRNTDGIIIEITLTTVKVQNWDKSISMVPSYALVSETFINYRGMEESNARRIQRSLKIDMNSIRYVNNEMVERLMFMPLIKDYLEDITVQIKNNNPDAVPTNTLVFIKYAQEYLKSKEFIRKDLTLLVRELQSNELGLPIEIYAYCSTVSLIEFEQIQTKIFDHFISIIPEFGLNIFQYTSQIALKSE
jgi:miniconductance mechanosensitive channel